MAHAGWRRVFATERRDPSFMNRYPVGDQRQVGRIRPRRATARLSVLLLCLVTAVTSVAAIPPAVLPSGPTNAIPQPPAPRTAAVADAGSSVFDNFNRSVSNGSQTWGTASSGASWSAYGCTGYTASVDGSSGVMTGSAGATCLLAPGANELTYPTNPAIRYWEAPSWAMTSKFKVSALDGSDLRIFIATQVNQYELAGVRMHFAASGGNRRSGLRSAAVHVGREHLVLDEVGRGVG